MVIGPAQGLQVLLDPRKECGPAADATVLDDLRGGEAAAVLFEAVQAEQLGANRRLDLTCGLQDVAGVRCERFQPVAVDPVGSFQARYSNTASPAAPSNTPVLTIRDETSTRRTSPPERKEKKLPCDCLQASM